jgi:serine phosphatase RsbU (regulator of sigma subunit)
LIYDTKSNVIRASMKLATKSVIPYLIILVLSSLLFSFSLYIQQKSRARSKIIKDSRLKANELSRKIIKSYPDRTMYVYKEVLKQYLDKPNTAYVILFSLDRNVNIPMFNEGYNIAMLRHKMFSVKNVNQYKFERKIDFSIDEEIYEISVPVIVAKTYYKELAPKRDVLVLSEKETKKYDFPEFVDQMVFVVKYGATLKAVPALALERIKRPTVLFLIGIIFLLAIIYKYEERLLNPVEQLISVTTDYSHNNKLKGYKIDRNDELGQLSENIISMHEKSMNSINHLYLANEYSQSLLSSPSISSLLNTVIFELLKLKNIERGGLLYWNEKRKRFAVKESRGFNDIHKRIGNDKDFVDWFLSNRRVLDPENFLKNFENYNSDEVKRWRAHGVELILPLILHEKVVGFVNLGKPRNKKKYSNEDKKFFKSLAQIAVIAVENLNLRLRQAQNLIIKKDLDFAKNVQSKLMPGKMPHLKATDFAIRMSPARNIGGDYYDFIKLVDGTIGIVIADVSGKGVPAALVMAATRSYLRLIAKENFDCSDVLKNLNRLLINDTDKKMFVTMFYSILDMNNYELDFSNAGHNFPLLYRNRDKETVYIQANGFPLGIMSDFKYTTSEMNLEKGDMVIYYTDGIIEAINYKKELFGFSRLEEVVNRAGHLGADEFLDIFMEEFNAFIGDEELHDDYTIMAIKIS